MQCIGHISASGDRQVPEVYRTETSCTLTAPREGVDLLFATSTHLLELHQRLVLRSCALPPSLGKVVRLGKVKGLREGWSYMVEGQKSVVFVDVQRFAVRERQYHGVDGVEVDDFLDTGDQLVSIKMGWGDDKVLTDGIEEIDLETSWPPDEDKSQVVGVLEKRLKEVRKAVGAALQEKDLAEQLKQESLAELGGKLTLAEKATQDVLLITGHWWRVLGDTLVLGLSLEATQKVGDVGLLLVEEKKGISYSASLVTLTAKDGVLRPSKILHFGRDGEVTTASLVVCLGLGQVMSTPQSTFSPLATLTYKTDSKDFCQTEAQLLVLELQQLRCSSSTLLLSFIQPDPTLQSLFALFASGAQVILRVSSERGSLQPMASMLDQIGLALAPSLGGFFTSPGQTLHPAGLVSWPESGSRTSVLMLASSASHLALLASLFRSVLPADTTFQISKDE